MESKKVEQLKINRFGIDLTVEFTDSYLGETGKTIFLYNGIVVAITDGNIAFDKDDKAYITDLGLKGLFWKDINYFDDLYYRIIQLLAPPCAIVFIIWLFNGILTSSN